MKYFTREEFEKTSHTGIDNRIYDSNILWNMTLLVDNVLDPIREAWGKAIRVNSGYRSPALNKKVGGASNSQHLTGQAADITVGSPTENKKLFDMIVKMGIEFDQLIDESKYAWVHISYKSGGNRKQILHL